MRRTDREVKSREEILQILQSCDVLRLGLSAPDCPYIVPMNFGIESAGESTTLWLHCANEGLKLDLIRQNPRAGFEADCAHRLVRRESACEYTMEYESVIGCGHIHICGDNSDKRRGLQAIMAHYAPEEEFAIPDPMLAAVCVLRLEVTQITGKRLKEAR